MGVMMSNVGGEIKVYDTSNPNVPLHKFNKDGTFQSTKATNVPIRVVTASNITAGADDQAFLFYGLSANKEVSLPGASAVGDGRIYKFGKYGSGNAGVVAPSVSGELIAGLTSVAISGSNKGFECISYDGDYYMLNCSDDLTTNGTVTI